MEIRNEKIKLMPNSAKVTHRADNVQGQKLRTVTNSYNLEVIVTSQKLTTFKTGDFSGIVHTTAALALVKQIC